MDHAKRNQLRNATRTVLEQHQLERLNQLLLAARSQAFYRDRLAGVSLPLTSLDDLSSIPLLTKADMLADGRGQPAKIFCHPKSNYTRLHQTSGTKGWPMPVLDTPEDWNWWLECWAYVLDEAEVGDDDVAFMAFSFGPFIGFWTANDALIQRGATVVPGGGMSSEARLEMIFDHRCSVVCCTPTYALHLANVAEKRNIDLASSSVTRMIVAGEPGGSVAAIRKRIELAWGARVVDHSGASELGAWGVGSRDGKGLHVLESEFIAERLRFDSDPNGTPVADGEEAELVLTNLGRFGGPAIRYRTGDVVRGYRNHQLPCRFLWLDGGVLGRSDDMMVIRGVNVFPSSVEAIVRELEPTAEFRMIASNQDEMDQLAIEIEASDDQCKLLASRFRDRLAMRVNVKQVPAESLPRFEAKARRWVDQRRQGQS